MSTPDDRDIRYAGQLAGIGMKGLLETWTAPPKHLRLIELPTPAPRIANPTWIIGDTYDHGTNIVLAKGVITGCVNWDPFTFDSINDARSFAKALLAAADTAEGKL